MVLSVVEFGSKEAGKYVSEPKTTYLAVTRISSAYLRDLKIEVGKFDFGAKCDLFSSSHNLLFFLRGPENKETCYKMLIVGNSDSASINLTFPERISRLPLPRCFFKRSTVEHTL